MIEGLVVEVECCCGGKGRWRVYVADDVRRCQWCGRTYAIRVETDPPSVALEIVVDAAEVGLLNVPARRLLSASSTTLAGRDVPTTWSAPSS
jgi:hypothetical protein